MKLTNKKVEQLITNTKCYIVWDTDVRGFGVRVNLNAKKTFILKYRVGFGRSAKVRKPVIGTAGIMKVEEARRIARKWLLEASTFAPSNSSSYIVTLIDEGLTNSNDSGSSIGRKGGSPHFEKLNVE